MHRATFLLPCFLLLCCFANARANLVASPAQLQFPLGVVGDTSAPLYVTLTNTGSTTLTVVDLTHSDTAFARAGGTCGEVPIALLEQTSCTVGYTFTPFFAGPANAIVRATPNVGSFVDVALVGMAVTGAMTAQPGQLMFPLQALGTTAGPLHVTLNNIGNSALTVVSLTSASGAYARAGGSCGTVPFTVAAHAGCTLGYTFTPTGIGTVYQTITATPAAGEAVSFGLAGEGDSGRLLVEPRHIQFAPTATGAISEESVATLRNSGRVPLQVTAIGPHAAPAVEVFVPTGGTCPEPPFTMPASDTCTVSYAFAPVAVGVVELDVQFHNNASSPETVSFSGEGLPRDVFADGFEEI